MSKDKHRSNCPISCSLELWGDKWSLIIIRDLMFAKQCTYGDLLKSEEQISTNILAARLKTLEQNMVIEKLEHPNSKLKVLYKLTKKGIELLPILIEINLWGEKYYADIPDRTKALLKDVKKDKKSFIRRTMKKLDID
ncbi:helix-turn-helix transcriptional regulator [Algibacter amylolyticus]|uniref:Helix-turn-helix transcriptional regulator n=1 Tax=Algibacter amylolyticus TaxID=1608400 RepID=A0A5M7BGG4_9FLAO|nr:helix-turn-helix domain-containing protein [Algibacter amylolyticus]KAA5827537.1 helix-turn-helix transcriptional regulator [Algibacter amylolyticus]MBB5266743.1 DNA-binding HxlR family transcriptional regulator [Algibacter amylolyticus]TSJ81782.1 helix-turn-helix transcriptional regulator [Algibacter amylolyticus]